MLDAGQLGLAELGWRGETPLWFYILPTLPARRAGAFGLADILVPAE